MWLMCADEPNPRGATIKMARDLNGDGRPEAVVTEGGTFCYGRAEAGYALLRKQAGGSRRLMTSGSGVPAFPKTCGVGNWPHISVGGPGFCFPVERWHGKAYELNRCTPQQ
jgi:hypothetical protein